MKRLKAAARWHARIDGNELGNNSVEFREWIGEPENKIAWKRVVGLAHFIDQQREMPELSELRAAAWRRAHGASPPSRNTFQLHVAAGAAAAFLILVGTAVFWPEPKPVIIYTTGVGQRRTIVLADKSRVILDSSSSVTVTSYTAKSRALTLTRGRANFDVVHDASRPFSVRVGNEKVVDVGTIFNVEKLKGKILVTLMQGRVEVEAGPANSGADARSFLLAPGQELTVNRGGNSTIDQIDPGAASAWQHGQVVFNDEPLSEAAERLNRYLPVPLKVAPEIADTRISGVFSINKLDGFVSAVTSYFPIQSKLERGHIVLQPRA